jgi:hypothetical protein
MGRSSKRRMSFMDDARDVGSNSKDDRLWRFKDHDVIELLA